MNLTISMACAASLAFISLGAMAKPIAFSQGTTVMAEYGAGTMAEAQVFYAPRYFLSVGGGYLALESDIDHRRREIGYARADRPKLTHDAIHNAARWPASEEVGERGRAGALAGQGRSMEGTRSCLRTQEVCSAHLHASCAEFQGSSDALCVCDTPRRDHRHLHCSYDLRD